MPANRRARAFGDCGIDPDPDTDSDGDGSASWMFAGEASPYRAGTENSMNTLPDEVKERVRALSEAHQAEVLDFIAFLAAKEAEDRADYEAAAEAYRTMQRTYSMEEVERELGLDD